MKYIEIKQVAGRLRKNPTASEKLMWEYLRGRKLSGYKFLRQHPLYYEHKDNEHFFFVPDFYCAELKLIIELDGEIHKERKEQDQRRAEILQNNGFKILRINNSELIDIESIESKIISYIDVSA
jgi:leucyl-tRNA synthetase